MKKHKIVFLLISDEIIETICRTALLPDETTARIIYDTNKVLIARILVTHLPVFRMFLKNVCGHKSSLSERNGKEV